MSTTLKIYSDGGSRGNPGPSASAFVVINNDKIIYKGSKCIGVKTNNEAEYYGVIIALEWLKKNRKLFSDSLKVNYYLDSELVTRQILGVYRVKVDNLKPLISKVKLLLKDIKTDVSFFSVPREKNKIADFLVNKEINENNV